MAQGTPTFEIFENGFPNRLVRNFNSLAVGPDGKTYRQTAFPSGSDWEEEYVGKEEKDKIDAGLIPGAAPRWDDVLRESNKALRNTAYVVDRIEGIGVNAALLFENGDGSGLTGVGEGNFFPGLVFESQSDLDGGYMGLFWTVDGSNNEVYYDEKFAGVTVYENYASLVGSYYNTELFVVGEADGAGNGAAVFYNGGRTLAVMGDYLPGFYNSGFVVTETVGYGFESRLLQAVSLDGGEGTADLGGVGETNNSFGLVSLASDSSTVYNDYSGAINPTQFTNGLIIVGSRSNTVGNTDGGTNVNRIHPQYVGLYSSTLCTIEAGEITDFVNSTTEFSTITASRLATLNAAQFSSVFSSQSVTISGASQKALIASSFNTTLDGVNHVAAVATNGFDSSVAINAAFGGVVAKDYSLVSDHIYAVKRLNLAEVVALPGDGQEGDLLWYNSSGTPGGTVRLMGFFNGGWNEFAAATT